MEQITLEVLMARILNFLGLTADQLDAFFANTGATISDVVEQVAPYVEIVSSSATNG